MNYKDFATFFDNPVLLSHTIIMRNPILPALVLASSVVAKVTPSHIASVLQGKVRPGVPAITLLSRANFNHLEKDIAMLYTSKTQQNGWTGISSKQMV